jgi:hypothetical protein
LAPRHVGTHPPHERSSPGPNSRIFDAWSAKHLAHLSFVNDFCRDGFCRGLLVQLTSIFGWGTVGVVLFLVVMAAVTGVAAFKTVINPAKQVQRAMRSRTDRDGQSMPMDVHEVQRMEKERIQRELERVASTSYTKTQGMPTKPAFATTPVPTPAMPRAQPPPPIIGNSSKPAWQYGSRAVPSAFAEERSTV